MKIKGLAPLENSLTGFTLLELIVVVSILSILASIAVPRLVNNIEKTRQAEAISILMKMYQGYKIMVIEGILDPDNTTRQLTNGTTWDPDYDHWDTDNWQWQILGFEYNPNYNVDGTVARTYFNFGYVYKREAGEYPSYDNSSDIAIAARKRDIATLCNPGWLEDDPNCQGDKWIYMILKTGEIFKSDCYK